MFYERFFTEILRLLGMLEFTSQMIMIIFSMFARRSWSIRLEK